MTALPIAQIMELPQVQKWLDSNPQMKQMIQGFMSGDLEQLSKAFAAMENLSKSGSRDSGVSFNPSGEQTCTQDMPPPTVAADRGPRVIEGP